MVPLEASIDEQEYSIDEEEVDSVVTNNNRILFLHGTTDGGRVEVVLDDQFATNIEFKKGKPYVTVKKGADSNVYLHKGDRVQIDNVKLEGK